MTHTKRWIISPRITAQASAALQAFPPILQQILFNRGMGSDEEARAFLRAQPNFNSDPFQLTGMQAAVERIQSALNHKESIAIYGDYDVDGVTATALMVQALEGLGANVRGYIPNRFDEGYGLNTDALDSLKADGVKLVITVDCGIRSPSEALHSQTIGLDLIISDHHHPDGLNLPPALAVINPKQHGDIYPDKDLAGVGIAYKIIEALVTDHRPQTADQSNTSDQLSAVSGLNLNDPHYWIVRNKVRWAPRWSDDEIEKGRQEDRERKDKYFRGPDDVRRKD